MGSICKRWVSSTRGEDDEMAAGPTCQPIKIKKFKNYFYGMTKAKIFFYKLEYLIFMKNIFLENTYTWSVRTCKFSAENKFILGYKKEKDLTVYRTGIHIIC
jgi:hypothetical protein